MKIKLLTLLNSNSIMSELHEQKMNGAVAFKLSQIIDEMEHRFKLYNETRTKIIKDNNGVLDKEENKYVFETKEIEDNADKEHDELLQQEVEINCRPLTASDLEKIPDLEPKKLRIISWAIDKEQ